MPAAGFGLHEALAIIRRRLWLVAVMIGVGVTGMVGWLSVVTPLYTAESAVIIETRKLNTRELETIVGGILADFPVVRSEMAVLQSWPILARVVDALRLDMTVEQGGTQPSKPGLKKRIKIMLGLAKDEPDPQPTREEVALALLRNVTVVNDGRSYIIRVRVVDKNPSRAAAIANEVVKQYLDDQLENKVHTIQKLNVWLNERTEELRAKMVAAETAVQQHRERHNLIDAKPVMIMEQLPHLNSQLALAAAERAEKDARLRQAQAAARTGDASGATEVLSSLLIKNLREQESLVIRKIAELSERYGDKHPLMLAARQEQGQLRAQVNQEIAKIVAAATSDAEVARARESSLRASIDQLQRQISTANPAVVRLKELEREAETTKSTLDAYLARLNQTSSQDSFQRPDARLFAEATAPTIPTFPKKTLFLFIAGAASGLIGLVLAFFMDRLDDRVRSGDQLERRFSLPCLGLIPRASRWDDPAGEICDDPHSRFAEAVRSFRAVIGMASARGDVKVVLFTSALNGEGKTALAVSLARSAALDGEKVMLIDCNLRNPGVVAAINARSEAAGLAELSGGDPSRPVRVDPASGLHYIPAGLTRARPKEVLTSPAFRAVLAEARKRYDIVILDAPALTGGPDAGLLARLADAAVVVAQYRQTPMSILTKALQRLAFSQDRLVAFVLTKVDVAAFVRYQSGRGA